jgi:hypothetical protein
MCHLYDRNLTAKGSAMSEAPEQKDAPVALERLRLLIAPVSQLIAIAAIIAGAAVWGLRLQDRIDKIDGIVQALATAPTTPISPGSGVSQQGGISSACTTLADRTASAMMGGQYTSAQEIRKLMTDLGCMKN